MHLLNEELRRLTTILKHEGKVTYCFRVEIDDTTTYNFTNYPSKIKLGSDEYLPYPIELEAITDSATPDVQTFNLVIANLDRLIATNVESGEILTRFVTVYSLYVSAQATGLDKVSFLTIDLFKILRAEATDNGNFFVFEIGQIPVYASKIPKNRWSDRRCSHVYKAINTCHYGRDEFEGTAEGTLANGSLNEDGIKQHNWRIQNSNKTTYIKINDPATRGFLTIGISKLVTAHLDASQNTAPIVYRLIPGPIVGSTSDGDFEVSVRAFGSGVGIPDENTESAGIILYSNGDNPSHYIHFYLFHDGTSVKLTAKKKDSGSESEVVAPYVSSHRILRIQKVGGTFNLFTRESVTDLWGAAVGSATISSLATPTYRVGCIAEANNGSRLTEWIATFDFFHTLAGGFDTCPRTFAACLERENELRYGGAIGILHGPLII